MQVGTCNIESILHIFIYISRVYKLETFYSTKTYRNFPFVLAKNSFSYFFFLHSVYLSSALTPTVNIFIPDLKFSFIYTFSICFLLFASRPLSRSFFRSHVISKKKLFYFKVHEFQKLKAWIRMKQIRYQFFAIREEVSKSASLQASFFNVIRRLFSFSS